MSDIPYAFKLGGREYTLTRSDIEERLKHSTPRPLNRYAVRVNSRAYPPKQVVSEALDLPLARFTTMDASRILSGLGFAIEESRQLDRDLLKTESEQLFEAYLRSSGLADFTFEKALPGSTKRPDYALPWRSQELLFDVKEFRADADDLHLGFGYFDPYGPIREKIEAGRRKFKDLQDHCCSLVLYNREKPLVDLGWRMVFAAMLGNIAFSVPLQLDGRVDSVGREATAIFDAGGKMHREKDGIPIAPQNQTISAVLVLQHLAVGQRRFSRVLQEEEAQLGRELELDEFLSLMERKRGTENDVSLRQLSVVVHENPYARIPLPRGLFCGPYDERYGPSEGHIKRIFAGDEILKLPE